MSENASPDLLTPESILVAGLDCGGTHTTCALANEWGEVLSIGEAGPGNICTHPATAPDAFRAALRQALERGGIREDRVSAAAVGCAGYFACNVPGGPEAALSGLLPLGRTEIVSDIEIALAGVAPGEDAVVLIAGTGSVAYGGTRDGQRARAGGWGYLLSDEGSAFWIGLQGVRASLRAFDGRGPETLLLPRLSERLGLDGPMGLEGAVYSMTSINTGVADLAPEVFAAAQAGDGVARSILDEGGRLLTRMVIAVLDRLHLRHTHVAIATVGGVLNDTESPLYGALRRLLAEAAPGARLSSPKLPPVGGAILRAFALTGKALSADAQDRLAEELPRALNTYASS